MGKSISHRIKGETAQPVSVLAVVSKLGVTRASKEIGTSTTTLHKARKNNVVSRVVEIAASHVLEHLGDVAAAPLRIATHRNERGRKEALFLIAVSQDKAPIVEQMAKALGAELVAA